MQSDADLLEFLKEGCRDKYFAVYRHLGKSDGSYIEAFFGICKFKPQLNLRAGAKNPPYEIIVMNNEEEITITDLPEEVRASAPVVIPAGKKYVIVSSVIDPNADSFEIINFTIGNIDLSTKTADAVWGTKVPATSQIRSGKDEGMDNLSYSAESVMFHKMTIENLETNVVYYAQAKSINTKGTVRLSDIVSFYVGNMIVSPVLVQLLINNINEVIAVTELLNTETLTAGIIENSNKDANEKSVGITADSSVITTVLNNTFNGIGTVVDYE
ncbi:MAG: hypothetical protein BWY46_02046 [Firmicutes bacterium ADurb.Bin300]|nr:MAG: hypothetical protein BWY46_02046 [Firmicutes bacterium ADurb.Bin300]